MTENDLDLQSLNANIAWLKDNSICIEYRNKGAREPHWEIIDKPTWFHTGNYYRIASTGPRVKTVSLDESDFEGWSTIWIKKPVSSAWLVTTISSDYVYVGGEFLSYDFLRNGGYERSQDRVSWKPFYKHVEL